MGRNVVPQHHHGLHVVQHDKFLLRSTNSKHDRWGENDMGSGGGMSNETFYKTCNLKRWLFFLLLYDL